MSVPSWQRKLSSTQFLYELYALNKDIGHIVMNSPKKYRPNYGDNLIKRADEAMMYAQRANKIYLTKNSPQVDKDERRLCLLRAKGLVDNISTTASLFLDLCLDCDNVNAQKIYKREADIGERCELIIKLLNGVMKSDKRFN